MAHVNVKKSEMEVHHRNAMLKLCGTRCGSVISHKKKCFYGEVWCGYWYTIGLWMVNVIIVIVRDSVFLTSQSTNYSFSVQGFSVKAFKHLWNDA